MLYDYGTTDKNVSQQVTPERFGSPHTSVGEILCPNEFGELHR